MRTCLSVGEASDQDGSATFLGACALGAEFTMTVLRLGRVIELKGRHP